MASLQIFRFPSGKVEPGEVDVRVLGKRPHRRLLREAVLMYEANRRAGTHSTKTRAEVAYTNKKPWAQKHTGRARSGTRRSPLWRGGGTIFGPRPRDYSWSMPRKALRAAVRSALLWKFLDGEVSAVDGFSLETPSTKRIAGIAAALGLEGRTLFVTPERDEMLWRSARNLEGASVRTAAEVNAYDLLSHGNLVLVNGAIDALLRSCDGGAAEAPAGEGEA